MGLIDTDYLHRMPLGLPNDILQGATPKIPLADQQEFIDVASTKVEEVCRRKFASTQLTQKFWGKGKARAMLRHFPVISLDSVTWEDNLGLSGTEDVDDIRLYDNTGILEWKTDLAGPFYSDRLYTVTYTTGFASVPGPVKMATAIWALLLMQPTLAPGRGKADDIVANAMDRIEELLEDYTREVMG